MPFPIAPEVLTALQLRIASTSLRRTAREVGLSPTGLSMLFEGRSPQPQTHHKLTAWFARDAAGAGDASDDVIDATLCLLAQHLPAERRREAVDAVREAVASVTRRLGFHPPEWTRTG